MMALTKVLKTPYRLAPKGSAFCKALLQEGVEISFLLAGDVDTGKGSAARLYQCDDRVRGNSPGLRQIEQEASCACFGPKVIPSEQPVPGDQYLQDRRAFTWKSKPEGCLRCNISVQSNFFEHFEGFSEHGIFMVFPIYQKISY